MSRLKAAVSHAEFHLLQSLILMLLIADVCPYHFFVQPHCGHEIASGPEHLTGEVPLPAAELPGDRDRALALHVSAQTRLEGNASMPLLYLRFL